MRLCEPNVLAAHLYLLLGDQMPEPVVNEDGDIDTEADNAAIESWSQGDGTVALITSRNIGMFLARCSQLIDALSELELDPERPCEEQYMTCFYDAARDALPDNGATMRTFFMWLYLVLFSRPDGSRWGDFVTVLGRDDFIALMRQRFGGLING